MTCYLHTSNVAFHLDIVVMWVNEQNDKLDDLFYRQLPYWWSLPEHCGQTSEVTRGIVL